MDPRLGRWLSADPKASKYPYESPYVFVSNNPLIYTDPDGEEKIIVVGGGDNSTQKDHNKFINSGLLQARNYANAIKNGNSNETVTILLNMKFVSGKQYQAMQKAMKTISKETGVKIDMIGTFEGQSTTNYINSKTPERGILSDARISDQITDMSFFGHGYAGWATSNGRIKVGADGKINYIEGMGAIEPGHGTPGETKVNGEEHQNWEWGAAQAQSINSKAFADNSKIDFYTCNAATPNKDGESLVSFISTVVPNSVVTGAVKQTSYDFIYNGRSMWGRILNWPGSSKAGGTQAVGEAKQLPIPTITDHGSGVVNGIVIKMAQNNNTKFYEIAYYF